MFREPGLPRSRVPPARCRSRPGGRSPPRHSVSSSSQAARGSPSRGWPTLPGLISQRPSSISSRVPAPACQPRASSPSSSSAGRREEQGHVGVADEADPLVLHREAVGGLLGPEHVLPDRVARRGVVERGLVWMSEGERPARKSRFGFEVCSAVHSTAAAAAEEKVEVSSSPSTARSWLPTRQTSQRSRASSTQRSGLGAVADHVAEAPALVDADLVAVAEDRLEGRQVGVDVAEDGYLHEGGRGGLRDASAPCPGATIVGADAAARTLGRQTSAVTAVTIVAIAVAAAAVAEIAVLLLAPDDIGPNRSRSIRRSTSTRARSRARPTSATGSATSS